MWNGTNTTLCTGLMGNTYPKIFAIILSILLSLIVLPFLYGIIWYEKFGTDSKRTLLNQLVSSICWKLIFIVLFLQFPMTIRIIFQEAFSHGVCTVIDFFASTAYMLVVGELNKIFGFDLDFIWFQFSLKSR